MAVALADRGGDLSQLSASDLMIGATTIPMKSTIAEALARSAESGGFLLAVNSDGVLKGIITPAELGSQLLETGLGRFVSRLIERDDASELHGLHRSPTTLSPSPTPAEKARSLDPTAEILPSKSQAQAHPWDSPTGAHPEPVPLVSPSDLVNPMFKVSDAMKAEPRTCSLSDTVRDAILIFRDANCGLIPIVEDDRPVGVLTDRDVALALLDNETDFANTPVSAFMSRDLVVVDPNAALYVAMERLGTGGVHRLLVVHSNGRLVGVLGWTDLIPYLSERGLGQLVSRIIHPL
ncbi:MAG: hypothetical protein NVSMB14_00230 [Isosphaeraceae bacterium]